MLQITPQQLALFTEPIERKLEDKIVAFVVSRQELAQQGDAEFMRAAVQQLIPRGRRNGLESPNDLVRYVYLSLLCGYRASGQDVCQKYQLPYRSDALRAAQARAVEFAAKGQEP